MNAPPPTIAMAGQSPQHFDWFKNYLLQGLDSGKGIFQFVSPRAHRFSSGLSQRPSLTEKSIVEQLTEMLAASNHSGITPVLGDRYTIISLDSFPGSSDEHCCFRLTVEDQLDGDKRKTIPITQVGMNFSDNFLDKEQIKRASALLDDHLNVLDPGYPPIAQTDPMIVSYKGIGRNAALISYREALSRITHGLLRRDLDDTLVDIVGQGRRDRGAKFLHTEQQLGAVHEALVEAFDTRRPAPVSRLPRPPVAVQRPAQPMALEPPLPERTSPVLLHEERSATAATVSLAAEDTIAPVVPVSARDDLLAFVDAHKNENPLQFMEVMARKNIDAAAFCAVQDKRMQTIAPDMPLMGVHPQSMHEGIEVHPDDDITRKPPIRVAQGSALMDLGANDRRDVSAHQVCLSDLTSATQPQTVALLDIDPTPETLFPGGLATALREGRFEPSLGNSAPPPKLDLHQLSNFVRLHGVLSLKSIEDLAVNNPAAAVLFQFIDHALLCSGHNQQERCERYAYLGDTDHSYDPVENTALPTFLEGVTYDKGYWHINGYSGKDHDKQVVVRTIVQEALNHLNCTEKTHVAMPVYPLVVYELLASITNSSVPQYLKDHEEETERFLANNIRMREERKLNIALNQQRTAMEREAVEATRQQAFIDNDVSSSLQRTLSNLGYPRVLKDHSVDVVIPIATDFSRLDQLSAIRQRLGATHNKQDISAKSHQSYAGEDNLCWLRSTWLSVFSTATPDHLGALLPVIAGPIREKGVAGSDAPLLQSIAALYRQDPNAFMHWEGNLGDKARLGPNLPLAEVLKDQLPAGNHGSSIAGNVEGFLRGLQIEIVTAFRSKGSTLMHELETLTRGLSPASSDLPVYLHRALNLPVLVIEAERHVTEGTDGREMNLSGQLRVAAPKGSPLAGWIEPLAAHPEHGPEAASRVMQAFDDKPVLWLENGHYDLYLPKGNSAEDDVASASTSRQRPSLMHNLQRALGMR